LRLGFLGPQSLRNRIGLDGELLDTAGIRVFSSSDNPLGRARVAFDGANFLVVWDKENTNQWTVQGARVTPEGVLLDSLPIPITVGESYRFRRA